ncbi:carboxypeptidase regulatory-like domain-containing protein [Cryocola sp. 340MFSha3.1]|uniref:MSCRAMM family protein n=1 Tax=Cryocola sp. 340MFSha3.1 TaxID=1169145 RepID=UPI000363B43A|nr:carboxypeptidase regulatory-like domain-containing protein [Cryocola sp. 340MFSha3.1]
MSRPTRTTARSALAGTVAAGLVAASVLLTSPASAATAAQWASWSTTGPGSYTMQVANTPRLSATVSTDSRSGQIGVISGTSTWLAAGTPVGQKYGSSQNQPYLNLRPKADTPTAPSTTTYAFAAATPTSGWAFVLGDIDADAVQVHAIGPDGIALAAAQLGFRGGFNYCAPGLAGKPSCTGSATDVPVWDTATTTLTGNAAAIDTSGAAAWFEPSAPISALTFVYRQRSGFPVFQTWFTALTRDITGTVTASTGSITGTVLTLRDADGEVVATTTPLADGTYAFTGVQASAGYTVSVTPPAGSIADGAVTLPADLSTQDAVADFGIHVIIPVGVSGTVRDTAGDPIAGVTVQLDTGETTTTGPDGVYRFEEVPTGPHTATVTVPAGYTLAVPPPPFAVPIGSEDPIDGVDAVLQENPDVTGRVTDAGGGVAGAVITAVLAGGGTVSVVTGADGSYTLPRVTPGSYTISVTPPPGTTVVGPGSQSVTVASTDIGGVDFALARAGAVEGVVSAGGTPVAGAAVQLTGPVSAAFTTGADGAFALGGLPAGTYTLTVTPPAGYTVTGAATRTFTITAAGEAVGDQDFALVAPVTPPPTSVGPAGPGAGTSSSETVELAESGSDAATGVPAGLLAVVALTLGLVSLVGSRRRRHS